MATKREQIGEVLESAGYESGRQYAPSTAGVPAIGAVSTNFNQNTTLGRTGTTIKDYAKAASEGKYSAPQRVGDYMVDPVSNTTTLVQNSPTDIVNRYVTSTAKPLQGMSLTDWMNVAVKGIMGWKGLPTNSESGNAGIDLLGAGATTAVGQLMSRNPATAALWAGGNALNAVNEIREKYFDEYNNQDFNYDLAGEFEKNEDGTTTFKPNYIKMAGAGPESGSAVTDAQTMDDTNIEITGDNQFKVRVSPVFAQSENYQAVLNTIKDNYSSMTVDEANEVVDKDTGATRLDTLNSVLKSAESNYLYNASVVKDVKEKAPTASDKSLNIAVETSKIGYLSSDQLEDVTVQVYNNSNELVEINAKKYLDEVAGMDKVGRENYMVSLGNRIADPNISDDEKAVLYAQSMALYAASSSDNADYKGMYQKGFWDEVGSAREIFSGITWNTYLGNPELTTFETNEVAAGALTLGTTFGSIKALTGITNLTEKGLRAVTPKLSSWAGQSLAGAMAAADESASTLKNLATIAGKSGTQLGYQVAADAIYDTAKLVPYALTGTIDDYDYLKELQSDFAMDMLVTYGPGQFVSTIESPKFEYRVLVEDAKTGEQKFVRYKDFKSNDDYKIITDSLGQREVKMVEVTGEELAKRRAETIDKLTNSKVALRVQELFFDKNSAMGKLAIQARRWGNKYQYQKMLRYSNDIRQVTADTLREYMANSKVSENWDKLSETLKSVAPTLKQFTQKDWDYIKAVINEYRFLGKNEGDAEAEKLIKEFYKKGKAGVSAERRTQLNKVISAMQSVASDVLDFYVEKGLMTQKAVDKLRNAPGYKNGMYLPMYVAKGGGVGGEISQDRQLYKRVRDGSALIALKDLDNPMNSLARYINNAMRAVAVNDRALAIQEAATIAGTGIHVVDDTGNSLKEVKNLKSLNDGFKKIFNGIRAQVHHDLPSFTQWQKDNNAMILRSNALKKANELSKLQEEAKDLRRQLRNARRRKREPEVKEYIPMFRGQETGTDDFYYNSPQRRSNTVGDGYFLSTDSGVSTAFTGSMANGGVIHPLIDSSKIASDDEVEGVISEAMNYTRQAMAGSPPPVPTRLASLYDDIAAGKLDAVAEALKKPIVPYTERGAGDEYLYYKGIDTDFDASLKKQLSVDEGESRALYDTEMFNDGTSPRQVFEDRQEWRALPLENRVRLLDTLDDKMVDESDTALAMLREEYAQAYANGEVENLRDKIQENKQLQLQTTDDLKRFTQNLMQRAQKAHKGSDIKLDIKSYVNVQVTNGLKDALKSEDMTGKIQKVLNDAVEKANPWVDREVVIQRRAESAALRYRKKVYDDIKAQKEKELGKPISIEKLNSITDKVMDKVMNVVTGERPAEVTFIDDEGVPTRLLDNHGQENTIRYMLNGEEQRMVLSGEGAKELVAEFYAPEFVAPSTTGQKIWNRIRRVGNSIAQGKRYLTTSANALRAPANLARDWSRGIVTTGGQIVISPTKFFNELIENGDYTDAEITKIKNGLMLARGAIDESTLNASLSTPYKNRDKEMVRAMTEPDGNAFIRFVYDLKAHPLKTLAETPQDFVEKYTRKRAMDSAYYKEIANAQSRGMSIDAAIKSATEAAYFAGRESTVNFFRRGRLVSNIAQQVPYLTQRFSSIESFKYAYLNDPIGVTRALNATVSSYAALIAIALSNEESRKKYFLLSEYDRSNNILIPIDNGMIMTIPLDETIAAFLTPYRRMVESLNGADPEAFYLCFAEGLEALSPADFSGFSEGDGFNIVRGFEKLGAEFIPTWAQPFVEAATGRDLYYGSNIRIDSDYTGMMTDNWTPTAGELTTAGKNSQTLAAIADHTGIPQWFLQNILSEYGGSIGEYALNAIDKISGATAEAQGGKEWSDTIFKAFTGSDGAQATNAFWDAINSLKTEKQKVQNEIKTITAKIEGASYNEKAELMNERQKKISAYGLKVTDVLNQYLSAFEITGGLSKKQANQAWYLYKLYDEDANRDLYTPNSTGDYFTDKAAAYNSKQATGLASVSGLDSIVRSPVNDFYDTYAEQAFKNTAYGDAYEYIANIEGILTDNNLTRSNMWKEYYSLVNDNSTKAQKKQVKAEWNKKVVKALAPYIQEVGVDNALDQRKVVDYLDEVIFVDNLYKTKEYLKSIFKE